MGKNKWEIDWKKIGKPKVKKVTEPSHGLGTGTGTMVMDRPLSVPDGGVKAKNIVLPQKPVVPDNAVESAAMSFVREQEKSSVAVMDIASDSKNINDENKLEVKKMDMSTIARSHTAGTYSETATENKDKLTEAPRPFKRDGNSKKSSSRKRGRDMAGGMGMLDIDFLLSVIEETAGDDKNDVSMRRMCFNELLRTGHRAEIDSAALKVYAMDSEGLYGKDIQCQAMQELTERTAGHN